MAKSDLLKQAIADANTVRETALANAKIALQEAFAPRIQRVLATSLSEQLEDEEEMDAMAEPVSPEAGAEEMGDEAMGDFPDSVNVGLDFDDDGEYDLTGMVGGAEEEAMPAAGEEMPANPDAEYDEAGAEELDLESIIRELEGDLDNAAMQEEDDMMMPEGDMYGHEEDMMEEDIDSIIEAILREEDMDIEGDVPAGTDGEVEDLKMEMEEKEEELREAYRTVKKLTSIINEVNLLNAKLLYTNKLFRNFELSENQKMKVIENFDRAGNTREVKLVFTTLAESFKKPTTKKRVVKESYASKPVATTAPSPRTLSTQVLSEGFEMAERWKKLAGLL
jgi:hypothetical protein